MQLSTIGQLLFTPEFWALNVLSALVANLLVVALWKGRSLVAYGVNLGLARRKDYIQSREHLARQLGNRENMHVLTFLVLNFAQNYTFGGVALSAASVFLAIALAQEGMTLAILVPLAVVLFLSVSWFVVTPAQKYYMVQYAMARVIRGALGSLAKENA